MYHKTRGIVLHTIKYSETSVIAKVYTEKLGLQSYMVKGVRAAKSKSKAAMLQPLTLLDMEVSHRENKGLQYIKEFQRAFIYQSIPFDTIKSTIAFFLLEVISKTIHGHEPQEDLFEFLYDSLCALDQTEKVNPNFHLIFLLHFSRYLGFAPHGNYSDENCFFEMSEGVFIPQQSMQNVMNKKESALLSDLLELNLFEPATLVISRLERKQMMKNLLKYYQFHLENFSLKSPDILEEIFE
ncbi:MAG: DNA repair protein RecO [Chitinophagales bacterium]|nr:DNA repair protein RecO [Chitinophagales bacterium]